MHAIPDPPMSFQCSKSHRIVCPPSRSQDSGSRSTLIRSGGDTGMVSEWCGSERDTGWAWIIMCEWLSRSVSQWETRSVSQILSCFLSQRVIMRDIMCDYRASKSGVYMFSIAQKMNEAMPGRLWKCAQSKDFFPDNLWCAACFLSAQKTPRVVAKWYDTQFIDFTLGLLSLRYIIVKNIVKFHQLRQ